jgi:hypothetical protein
LTFAQLDFSRARRSDGQGTSAPVEYQYTIQGISPPPAAFEDFSVDGTLV